MPPERPVCDQTGEAHCLTTKCFRISRHCHTLAPKFAGRSLKSILYIPLLCLGSSFLTAGSLGDSALVLEGNSRLPISFFAPSPKRDVDVFERRTLFLPKTSNAPFVRQTSYLRITQSTIDLDSPEQLSSSASYLKPALFVGGALAITGALIWSDQRTYETLYDWKTSHSAIRTVSPIITNLGDGRTSMAMFGGFLAYSYIANDRTAMQAGKIGLESFLLSGITAQILKHTFGRERPSVASVSGGRWNGAFLLLNQGGKRGGYAHFDAFPSGHTTTVFAAATTLSEVYHDSPWVSYASYSVASVVAVSRVMEQTHWLSDCFVGGLIGYFSTQLVIRLNNSGKPVALVPVSDGQYTGLALNVGL